MMMKEQAESCRRQANEFAGRPEAPFLLRVASVFDELAIDESARFPKDCESNIIRPRQTA